jgi:hypothetical protein
MLDVRNVQPTHMIRISLYSRRCHPIPGPERGASLSTSLSVQSLSVEYRGHTYVM